MSYRGYDRDDYDRRSSRDHYDRYSRDERRSNSRSYSQDYEYDRRGSSRKRSRSRSPYDDDDWRRRRERDNERSGSPYENEENIKLEIKEEDLGYWNERGYLVIDGYELKGTTNGFNEVELKALRLPYYCEYCKVKLGDPESMRNHIRGMKHIQEKKTQGIYVPGMEIKVENDRNFWIKQDNKLKSQQANRNSLDNDYSKKKSNFKGRRYDMGQFRESMYCDICGVTVHSRDTMENHIQGAEHKRRAKVPEKFECKLCLIVVPCQNTLNSHLQGKDHIKRMNEEKLRKERGENTVLSSDDIEELKQVKLQVKNLQKIFDKLLEKQKKCKTEHKDADTLADRKRTLENELKQLERRYEKGTEEKRRLMKERDELRKNPGCHRPSPPRRPRNSEQEYEEVSRAAMKQERKVDMEAYMNNVPSTSSGHMKMMKPKKEEYEEVMRRKPKKEELFDRAPTDSGIEIIDID